ncbi:DUF4105 domain-containing protein [Ulvibacterium marinum]|uniref:DUF4105 domain-containing protein n=1 Tax=Ulvibacterium marinum TaxID=2419782 RepID=A0A3B0C3X1_9FLAO|nr:DUF4105 domain-containing protein [Ulvibacterium marinum]RKN80100.1 DUF4105 domain-containing protein [Ulvibacterium marinum]
MRLKALLLTLSFSLSFWGISQEVQLSQLSRISVLTCGSGSDLYTTFGHSAFRVNDPSIGIDVVYNYGTFNFNPPKFYFEFAQGKLLYSLSRQKMDSFLSVYKYENRWVKEQILDLTQQQRQELFRFLEVNNRPENRTYKYDFFYDNCASKIWDVLKEVYGEQLQLKEGYLKNLYTFRELIHQHLETNSWSAFGIDLALGSVIDKIASPKEHMFLPIYVMQQLEGAQLGEKPIAYTTKTLLQTLPTKKNNNFFLTPLFWLLIVLATVWITTFVDFKKGKRSRWLDFTLFFSTGLAGCLIFYLWFLTDHTATIGNLNILWAFPLNLILSFFLIRRTVPPKWLSGYLKILMGLLVLVIVFGLFKVQVFSPLLLPILLALGTRYFYVLLQLRNSRTF